jgi:hypothetical protein
MYRDILMMHCGCYASPDCRGRCYASKALQAGNRHQSQSACCPNASLTFKPKAVLNGNFQLSQEQIRDAEM